MIKDSFYILMKSPLEQFDIVNVKTFNTTLVDISLNNILIPFLLLLGILGLYLFIFKNKIIRSSKSLNKPLNSKGL